MTPLLNPATGVLIIPVMAAFLLAMIPSYRIGAWLNVIAATLTFASALALLVWRPPVLGRLFIVDDLNIVFIVLNTLVGFTTSLFE